MAGPEADDADGVADIATNGVADRTTNGATNADVITDGGAAAGDLLADPSADSDFRQDVAADQPADDPSTSNAEPDQAAVHLELDVRADQ